MGKKKSNKQNCEATEQVQTELENLQEAENIQKSVESLIDLIKTDGKNYSEHLKKAQNIQKNIQSLIDLTIKIQSGNGCDNVADVPLAQTSNKQSEESSTTSRPTGISLPMTEASDDWMDDCVVVAMEDEVDQGEDVKVEEAAKVEEIKKPSGISLPMTGASDDWMEDEVGLTMDDEDEEKNLKVDEDTDVKFEEEAAKVEEIKKPSGISLPMTGASDDWMEDEVGLTMDDEDEEENVKEDEDIKVKEEAAKVEEIKKPSGISLPMTGASDDWMEDEVGLTMDDEDEDVKEAEDVKVEEIKKPSGISLPMTGASDDWMEDEVGLTMDDEEEGEEMKTETKESNVSAVNELEESKSKPAGISLPMTGASDDWMEDEVGLTMDDEEDNDVKVEEPVRSEKVESIEPNNSPAKNKKKKSNGKKDKTKKPDQTTESKIAVENEIAKTESKPKIETSSVDAIDSVLDDWLKGGDEEIPEELPNIDVKSEKKDVKSLKTQKANEILSNMNKLSGIMDDRTNTNIQGSVENFFGGKKGEKKSDKKVEKKKVEQKPKDEPPQKKDPEKETESKTKPSEDKKIVKTESKPNKVSSDDIDSLMDDWLNGGDDGIPEELPDIDVKTEKKESKSLKSQKANAMLFNMNKLSGIIDDGSNIDGSVENSFNGRKEEKVSGPKIEKRPDEDKADKNEKEKEEMRAKAKVKEDEAVPVSDCAVCSSLAKAICTGCKAVFYCTRACQKKHWTTHKEDCKSLVKLPYRVERSDVLGRFLRATKDIEEGELIFEESPMVVGPKQLTVPVCLGCHKEITSTTPFVKCSRCNWPVCSQKCGDNPVHDGECRATRAAGARIKVEHFEQVNMMYACITVLRALALKDGPRKIWEDYTKFDSHLPERLKTTIYNKVNKEKVCFFILHYLNIKRYSDMEIMEACGKLDTNCFEIKQNGLNLRAMYRLASIMSHECTPNTRHTFGPDNSIFVYSTRKIKKDEIISATYTKSLFSTVQRLEHLNMSKCFWCSCSRCSDPTENQSYMSGMKCSKCSGYLLPTDPLNLDSNWKCSSGSCSNEQRASGIKSGNLSITNEVKELDGNNLTSLTNFLIKYENLLGPFNHHIAEIKFKIVLMLGNNRNYKLSDLTREQLELKERFATEMLELADKIEPGSTKFRGQLLLELQIAQVSLAAGLEDSGEITKFAAKEKASVAFKNLQEAVRILQVEPDMKAVLEDRMNLVTTLLSKWEE